MATTPQPYDPAATAKLPAFYYDSAAAAARAAAVVAMYQAKRDNSVSAFQAAARSFAAAAGGLLPVSFAGDSWNPPELSGRLFDLLYDAQGNAYLGGEIVGRPAAPITAPVILVDVPAIGGGTAVYHPPPPPAAPAQNAPADSRAGTAEPRSPETDAAAVYARTPNAAPRDWETPGNVKPQFISIIGGAVGGSALGGPVGTVIGVVVGVLGALFGGLFGGGNANKAIGQLRDSLVSVSNALTQGLAAIARTVGHVLKLLGGFFSNILTPLVSILKKLLEWWRELYDKVLKPIITTVEKIRREIIHIYEHYVRPFIVVLDKVRRILAILKLFHVKFAEKLDRKIVELEGYILEPLRFALKYLNVVGQWLNILVTVNLVIQRAVWHRSIHKYKNAMVTHSVDAFTSTPLPQFHETQGTAHDSIHTTREYLLTGAGPMLEGADQARAAFTSVSR
jgi:hypothetical protein